MGTLLASGGAGPSDFESSQQPGEEGMFIEKLINAAGIAIGVGVVSVYNDHAAATIAGFFKNDPYGEASRLLSRAMNTGHWFTETMTTYASDNVPAFCFAMVAAVLAGAMLKS